MTENTIYLDENGRRYYHGIVWFTNVSGRMDCKLTTIYLDFDDKDELDMRVFYDEDIARILNWFEWEQIIDGTIFDFWMCNDCGEFKVEEQNVCNDDLVCSNCIADNYYHCDVCGDLVHAHDATQTNDGNLVCQVCLDEHYTRCFDCEEYMRNDNVVGDENISLCQRCYSDHWFRCDDCGYLIHEDDMCSDDGGCYCQNCFEENRHGLDECDEYGIYEYGYRPSLKFRGEGNLYFGTEMEIDYGNLNRFNFDALPEMFYPCHDGSLEDEGFEIISHPMTYDWIMEHTPYKAVCKLAKDANYKAHNTDTCGFHVHMSRRAFGDPWESSTDDRITSFMFFFEKFWTEIVKFSRRKHDFTVFNSEVNEIDHYASRLCTDNTEPITYEVVKNTKEEKGFNRYQCVNLCNDATIEVRIFKGTIKENTIIASIQLCKLFFELSVFDVDTIEHMTWEQIKTYAETDYPELLKYLKERNL